MKNIMVILAIAAVVLQVASPCVQAQNGVSDRESLRGIKRVGVAIGKLSPAAKKIGINRDALRRGIEAQLRQAGITVAGPDELHADPEIPYLQTIFFLSDSEPACSYTVMLGLSEKVHLAREPKIISYAMPWWRILRGECTGKPECGKQVEDTLQKLLKEFINDYFSANPKQAIR